MWFFAQINVIINSHFVIISLHKCDLIINVGDQFFLGGIFYSNWDYQRHITSIDTLRDL